MLNEKLKYFSKTEKLLWLCSVLTVVVMFLLFDRHDFMKLCTSLIGVTSLIFLAKGNPVGQILMIIFSLLYGVISFTFAYYGEMVTYLGMTLPMSVIALVSWLRHPYNGHKSAVEINHINGAEIVFLIILTAAVTTVFYFILKFFQTANLIPSTFSVTTSFAAAYLTFRRSPYYAVGYALNDLILIIMWILATIKDVSYLSVVVCFSVFFVNDSYGLINWLRMDRNQNRK